MFRFIVKIDFFFFWNVEVYRKSSPERANITGCRRANGLTIDENYQGCIMATLDKTASL